jgi:membrane dipeptidase
MRIFLAGAMTALLGAALLAQQPAAPVQVSERARRIHQKAIVVDTHCDVTQRLISRREAFDISRRDPRGHVDIPRAREGGMGAVFFSIYMSGRVTGPDAVERSLRMIDAVYEAARANPRDLAIATSAAEVRRARKEGKIAALMGMEGGHMINDSLANLRMYAQLGVRYLTLTHGVNTNWADSSTDTPKHNGLTDFGKQVVRELNRLGVMVDVSHVSDKTFYDALEVSAAPLMASHSSCRALCSAPRNMSDDMIRALAGKGGVIQITFVDSFLSEELRKAEETIRPERDSRRREELARCGEDEACRIQAADRVNREFASRLPKVPWELLLDHIDHAVKIAGVDHVGIGTDFDGATMPHGFQDATRLPLITEGLLKRGYSERDILKILGGNTLRLMEDVERASRQLRSGSQK